jgi:hypothetical protein
MRILLLVRERWSAGEVGLNKSTVEFATIAKPGGRKIGEIRIPEAGRSGSDELTCPKARASSPTSRNRRDRGRMPRDYKKILVACTLHFQIAVEIGGKGAKDWLL